MQLILFIIFFQKPAYTDTEAPVPDPLGNCAFMPIARYRAEFFVFGEYSHSTATPIQSVTPCPLPPRPGHVLSSEE